MPSKKRPKPSAAPQARWLGRSEVDGAPYDAYLHPERPLDDPTRLTIELPAVPAGPDGEPPEIPARAIPHRGFMVPMAIALREANGVVGGRVEGLAGATITMNGRLVYGLSAGVGDGLEGLLLKLGWIVSELRDHPVWWWDDVSWKGRPVWYQGVPATIEAFVPASGVAMLMPADGYRLPDLHVALEAGIETLPTRWVDILDPSIGWTRTRDAVATRADDGSVHSEHGLETPAEDLDDVHASE
jgi:hypothetical protein